jgi:hypothetical protein
MVVVREYGDQLSDIDIGLMDGTIFTRLCCTMIKA